MALVDNHKKNKFSDVAWTLTDVLIIIISVLIIGILFSVIVIAIFGDNKIASKLTRYVSSVLMICFPLLWINKKYGLTKCALGLRKGDLCFISCTLSIAAAVAFYYILLNIGLIRFAAVSVIINYPYSYIDYILLPISIGGFASIVLTPIGEEIMMRGFVYGYFRNRLGIMIGLFVQALLFSLLHFSINVNDIICKLILGVVLGLLYEKTDSLYPSILFHSVFNYLGIIGMANASFH